MFRVSAGNLATSNYKQIEELTKIVSEFATKIDLDQQRQATMNVQQHLSMLRNDFDKSLCVIDQLSNSQLHASSRIYNLETNMATKIDRSECDHLESLVAKVMLYDSFKVNTIESLARLDAFQSTSIVQHDKHDKHFKIIDQQIHQITYDITQASTKHDTNLIAKQLQQHDHLINDLASKATVEGLNNQLQSTNAKCMNAITDISSLDKRITTTEEALIKKASLTHLKKEYVSRVHYEQALSSLSTEIEYKSNQTTVAVIQDDLKVISMIVKYLVLYILFSIMKDWTVTYALFTYK